MDRRDFIKIGLGGVTGAMVPSLLSLCSNETKVYGGWTPNPQATSNFIHRTAQPFMMQRTPRTFTGSGKGRVVLLHKYLEKAVGEIIPHHQEIGDCVGQAYGLGIDTLSATQIYGLGLAEKWNAKASTEAAYAGSRYEIGFQLHGNAQLLAFDGSNGSYCAEFLHNYGALVRKRYGDIDLTKYSAKIAHDWGKNGVPDELEPLAKKHPIRSFALVRSYEEVRDAICNGYPVIVCSDVGFKPDCREHNPGGRDSQGFLKECGTWYHAQLFMAVDDTRRPGILCMNSWGPNWVRGPKRHGQPDGSYWIDANTVDKMVRQGDSYAISGFTGFPSKKLHYDLF